jgi:hypothetical protein
MATPIARARLVVKSFFEKEFDGRDAQCDRYPMNISHPKTDAEILRRYRITTVVVDAVRAGIAKTKHHARYTARVHDAICAELKARLNFDPVCHFGNHEIAFWGHDIAFDGRIYLLWSWPHRGASAEAQAAHWSVPILAECERVDRRDYIERLEQEQSPAMVATLQLLADEAAGLVARLKSVRARAQEAVQALPLPGLATIRAKSVFWDGPSETLQRRFPSLWPAKKV